jgi:hypothetical protein
VLIPSRPELGDLDMLFFDATHALLLELRWTIPPAEPKEIFNRASELRGKQAQLQRKLDGLTPAALQQLCAVPPGHGISLAGAVAIEGWAGTPLNGLTIINFQLLLRGIKQSASLADLANWINAREWLPEVGRHFLEQRGHASMGDLKVGWIGMSLTPLGQSFAELATLSGSDRLFQERFLAEYTGFFDRLKTQRPDLVRICEACQHHGPLIEQLGTELRRHTPKTRTDAEYHHSHVTVRLPLDEPSYAIIEVGTARSIKEFRRRLRKAGLTHADYLARIGNLFEPEQIFEMLPGLQPASGGRTQPLIGHIVYSILDRTLLVALEWPQVLGGFLIVPHELT